ncbi:MAG: hypothetical protein K0S97_775 [Chloroflexota bacterium]|nr:hypothetical protein [Chloroflexota bacterium]
MGRRRMFVALLALSLGLLVRPVAVGSAVACSCAMDADPIVTAAQDPDQAIFTGVVQEPAAQGTPVILTRWFRGAAPQAVVWLDNAGFEDPFGGMCGTARPPANSEWIFAAYRAEAGKFGVDLCSPHASLATPEGQRMLQSATEVLGPPAVPAAQPDPGEAADPVVSGVVAILVGLVALTGLAAGIFLVAGRRRET